MASGWHQDSGKVAERLHYPHGTCSATPPAESLGIMLLYNPMLLYNNVRARKGGVEAAERALRGSGEVGPGDEAQLGVFQKKIAF